MAQHDVIDEKREDVAPAATHAADKPAKKGTRKKRQRSGLSKLRSAMPAIVLVVLAAAFVLRIPLGNLSSIGPLDISVICPIGALSTLLASKAFIPHAVISLVVVAVLVVLFGRAFCSWVCSVPLMQRILGVDPTGKKKAKKKAAKDAKKATAADASDAQVAAASAAAQSGSWEEAAVPAAPAVAAAAVAAAADAGVSACPSGGSCSSKAGGCSSCAHQRQRLIDSRHWILGGSLLSAAIFGFPVFCIICPVGLTFALVFLIVRLFSGSVSWALLVVPLMLIVELVFLRKWCHQFCPIGALMSLLSKFNRTFVPTIDTSKCIETTTGHTCGRCTSVCPEHINLRDLAASERGINECVKCRQCVDVCPKGAIKMPLVPKKKGTGAGTAGPTACGPIAVGADGSVSFEEGK